MYKNLRGTLLSRDEMSTGLVDIEKFQPTEISLPSLAHLSIGSRCAFFGKWNDELSDPFPEVIIVNDRDHADTIAWVSSYFPNLSPITQWCRIYRQSEILELSEGKFGASLHGRVGPWIGAIISECSSQAFNAVNLKELSGNAALSTASYTAARSFAVTAGSSDYNELAKRHDQITHIFRDGSRPLSAQSLIPLWSAISNNRSFAERRSIEPFARIFDYLSTSKVADVGENVRIVLEESQRSFNLPELFNCARGPQAERVRSLDILAEKLASDPKTSAVEAIIGLAASLVDPGMAVMPDLLRKYIERFPTSPVWMGAFAGALSPVKVLSDFGGLGRLILKPLLCEPDVYRRPEADISYDELVRWVEPSKTSPLLSIRAMASRSLNVELLLGVTGAFSQTKGDTNIQRESRTDANANSSKVTLADNASLSLQTLARRVERLEQAFNSRSSYLPGLGPQDDASTKRGAARPKNKR